MLDVDETRGSYWTKGGLIHRARLLCSSCNGSGWLRSEAMACGVCVGTGFIIVGCGGEGELDPVWSETPDGGGLGYNCMRCNSLLPRREFSTPEQAARLAEMEPERWGWTEENGTTPFIEALTKHAGMKL